ncbi:MAG: AsmA family protein [Deltaproteobacteria bacterium]|nr:AsmA family protein [Deltaproteobacteria bacterium]
MKKWIKIGIIVLGIFLLLFIGLNIFIKSYLSSERLKAMILPKAEALTGRKVNLEDISVSLFKGVVARGLSVKEMDGQKDFLRMKEFVLDYRLLPLLKKEFVISKIELISPFVTIVKDRQGKYNFSSIADRFSQKAPETSQPKSQGLPVSIVTDRVFIKDLQFKFVDEEKALPDVLAALDMVFMGSVGQDRTPRMKSGQISIKEIKVILKGGEIKTTGKIDMDEQTIRANLKTAFGKDSLDLTATVKDYLKAPEITANLYSKELDLGKWMGLGGEEKAPKKPPSKEPVRPKEKAPSQAESRADMKLKASGAIKVDVAKYQGYIIKGLNVTYQYVNGAVKIEPLGLQFSGGDVYNTEGNLGGKLHFNSARIQETLKGDADLKLGKGVIKGSPIFEKISSLTGIKALKEPVLEEGSFRFDFKEEKVFLDGFIRSALFRLSPKGYMGFDQKMDIPVGLKVAPELSKSLSKEVAKTKFMTDEKGWTVIPLKIKGTTEKPDVNIDTERLVKQIVPELTRDIEKRLFQKKKSSK